MTKSRVVSLISFVSFLSFYTFFVSPGLLPADSGEFQVVAPLLGVAHPPGFPFYTLLGKLFISLVPISTPAYRLNLLSAALAALTLTFVIEAVRALTGSRLAGLIAAAALAVSTTFWSQATTANVRMLTALCAAMCVYALVRRDSHKTQDSSLKTQSLIPNPQSLFFLFALGLGVSHHASLAFMGVVIVLYFLLLKGWRLTARWAVGAALAFAVPFLFDLYLPLRGAAGAFLAPPHLATLPGFLEHVLARGFEGDFFYFAHWRDLPDRLAVLGNILSFQFNPVLLIGMAFGGLVALRRDWRLFFLLGGAFVVHSFVAVTYRAPQTVEYMLPAYVALIILLGCGIGYLLQGARGEGLGVRGIVLRIAYCVLPVAVLALLARNAPSYLRLARDESARDYAEAVLKAAPPGAVVLSAWHWATPMWYLQEIEGVRPDVEVEYVFPQGLSLAQNWVERIGANVEARPVVVTSFYPAEFERTGYRFVPLGPAWLASDAPFTASPVPLTPVEATFGGRWRLGGFALDSDGVRPGETVPVVVGWVTPAVPEDVSFFVQLIGPDGALYGQKDVNYRAARAIDGEWLIDRYPITVRPDAPPGDYALVAGAYLPDGTRLTVDENGADTLPLATIRVLLADQPPATRHPVLRPYAGTRLIGWDYDHSLPDSVRLYLHWQLSEGPEHASVWMSGSPFTELDLPAGPGYLTTTVDLPAHAARVQIVLGTPCVPGLLDWRAYNLPDPPPESRYVPLGGALVLTGVYVTESAGEVRVDLELLSTRPLTEDDIIKVDLIGANQAWGMQSDAVPAGGAIPTLKWVAGSLIHDRHRFTIPTGAAPGPARLELAAYDHFTERVLPILDPRLALIGSTVPLGEITVGP